MSIDELASFNLAGGTALALQIGHRHSFDLDFFGSSALTIENVLLILKNKYSSREIHRTKNILITDIAGVKVDFVKYNYPLIGEVINEKGIRLLSIEDIGAMKLDAIKGRGKKRDFYDLYFLLQKFELSYLFELHLKKYQEDTKLLIIKSMIYFDDAEDDAPVQLLKSKVSWQEVKKFILEKVKLFQKGKP
ncbi:MAG: nucleotidyl transferase AbiEii/AbiGii toxin family protein [Bacteroidota bacterium]|nr:nucleotidyl transferase AbiEii/AbiGii toxin family protein [Bacteroidota bacterium]